MPWDYLTIFACHLDTFSSSSIDLGCIRHRDAVFALWLPLSAMYVALSLFGLSGTTEPSVRKQTRIPRITVKDNTRHQSCYTLSSSVLS